MAGNAVSDEGLPLGAEIDADGLWSQVLNRAQGAGLRPGLFLDRDGLVVEEVHYLHRPADVRLIDGAAGVITKANVRGFPVILVTNQAGIAHGRYGWGEFAEVQEKIIDDLAAEGAFINAVFACPHHGDGRPPYDKPDHSWRKPNPGMLLATAERLPVDLGKSWIVGDRAQDLAAGKGAGLAGGVHVLTGHGGGDGEREEALRLEGDGFKALTAADITQAASLLPSFKEGGG
ncbi:MAG TPA: HAD-IIIA family hydrolase [Rhodospirillales bacterium]|nr:HAD-IIIA family hydrolase [Rhodospirillales bacterium]